MSALGNMIRDYEEEIKSLQKELVECKRQLKWAKFGEDFYSKWTNKLLIEKKSKQ